MKTATFFAYRGNVGGIIDPDGTFINDPHAPGQVGAVISTDHVTITKEAKEILRGAKRDSGSFAPLMLTKHDAAIVGEFGKSSIGIIGGVGRVHLGEEITIGRTCDLSIIDDCEEIEMEVPDDYKAFIDEETK